MPIPERSELEKLLDELKIGDKNLRSILVCLHDAARIHARSKYEEYLGEQYLSQLDEECRKIYIVGVPLSMLGMCKETILGKGTSPLPQEFCNAATVCVAVPATQLGTWKKLKLQKNIANLATKLSKCIEKAKKGEKKKKKGLLSRLFGR